MLKYFIETYGCQMNEYDSELIANILDTAGYEQGENIEESNIIIFNTCAIRQHAETRIMGRVSQINKLKENRKFFFLGLVGCVAQEHGEALLQKAPYLDFVVGPDHYSELPLIIEEIINKNKKYSITILDHKTNYENIIPKRQSKLHDFVAIMRGCNNFCSYCIVPYVRGRERSRLAFDIINEINDMASKGFKEVTLIGQNVNSYYDEINKINFADLLKMVNNETDIKWIRFLTSHPKNMTSEIIDNIANLPKLCEHVHLPAQSGSTRILTEMNRNYTREKYISIAKEIRDKIPGVSITTDLIAGFPGETDEEFQETIDLMNEIMFDSAFTYKYSPRKFTKAAELPNQLPNDIKQSRLEYMINLQQKITRIMNERHIGETLEVLPERISKKRKTELAGRARNNKWVIFKGSDELIGKFVNVKIEKVDGFNLIGTLVE